MNKYKSKSGFLIREPIRAIGDNEIIEAKKKYLDARARGIILSDYQSNKWILSDQRSRVNFEFDKNINILMGYEKDDSLSVNKIIDYLKVFVLLRMGTCTLVTLREFINFTLMEIEKSCLFSECKITPKKNNSAHIYYYLEFVKLLIPKNTNYLEQCGKVFFVSRKMNAESKKDSDHPCELNEFQSYFRFDEVIRDWWNFCTEKEKGYYYPIYLFWIITTILPMRVTEFCLTPLKCIRQDDGRYYLTIRRSRLKGGYNEDIKIHYYSIDKDYDKHEYEIPEWLYRELENYINNSEGYSRSFELLFSMEYLYSNKKGKVSGHSEDRVFDRDVLGELLSEFYSNVVLDRYKLVDEETLMKRYLDPLYGLYQMEQDEIMKIHPKHTRHLSMINLILRGCNPMMIKEFAGHAIETTSSNYYGNVSKTVRCATKFLYDKTKSQKNKTADIKEVNPLSLMINKTDQYIEVDEGRCYSKNFLYGNSEDCTKCGGVCQNCRYCVPDKKDYCFTDIKSDSLNEELEYLVKMLSEKDIENRLEEYQVRMQRLEKGLANYSERFYKFLVEEDIEYAT